MILSFDQLTKCVEALLGKEKIDIVEKKKVGDDMKYIIKLLKDIDNPDYYEITVKKL